MEMQRDATDERRSAKNKPEAVMEMPRERDVTDTRRLAKNQPEAVIEMPSERDATDKCRLAKNPPEAVIEMPSEKDATDKCRSAKNQPEAVIELPSERDGKDTQIAFFLARLRELIRSAKDKPEAVMEMPSEKDVTDKRRSAKYQPEAVIEMPSERDATDKRRSAKNRPEAVIEMPSERDATDKCRSTNVKPEAVIEMPRERDATDKRRSAKNQPETVIEMPCERGATDRRRSAKDKMNLLGQLSTITLDTGKIEEECVLLEILLALPFKSLSRFKCVCKSWCSLISNPQFGKSHLIRSMLQNTNSSQKLVFQATDPTDGRFTMKSLDYERCYREASNNADDKLNCLVRLRFPITQPGYCTILGSCDGLVCFLSYYSGICLDIVIWNPTTGVFKEIQPPPASFFMLGFGYDGASRDYKVVACIRSRLKKESDEVLVFALKEESWRVVCEMPTLNCTFGVYLNGCIHLLAYNLQLEETFRLLSFDLSKEEFKWVIPAPDIDIVLYSSLGILGGCLCLYSMEIFSHNKCYIMGEYGVKSSWTEFQLPDFNASYPLCITTDGKVLGVFTRSHTSNGINFHSLEDNSCQTASIGDLVISNPCVYVETLLSPYPLLE